MANKRSWRVRGDKLQLRVSDGCDPVTGKRIVYTQTVTDLKENGRHLSDSERNRIWDDYAYKVRNGMVSKDGKVTVEQILHDHIKKNYTLSANTRKGYEIIISHRIPAAMLKRKASDIKKSDIREWLAWLSNEYRTAKGKPLSVKSIKNSFGLVAAAFQTAVSDDILIKNPCSGVRLPREEKKEKRFLSDEEEIRRFVDALLAIPEEHQDEKVSLMLALFCGLRKGEIHGLDENDIDLEKRVAHIHQARYYVKEKGMQLAQTKSACSDRDVGLPSILVNELEKLRLHHLEERLKLGTYWKESPALIKNNSGEPLYTTILHRFLCRILEENDLPHMGLHGLRHTYASALDKTGIPLAEISDLLGHANVGITNRYIHSLSGEADKTSDKVEAFMMGNAV